MAGRPTLSWDFTPPGIYLLRLLSHAAVLPASSTILVLSVRPIVAPALSSTAWSNAMLSALAISSASLDFAISALPSASAWSQGTSSSALPSMMRRTRVPSERILTSLDRGMRSKFDIYSLKIRLAPESQRMMMSPPPGVTGSPVAVSMLQISREVDSVPVCW